MDKKMKGSPGHRSGQWSFPWTKTRGSTRTDSIVKNKGLLSGAMRIADAIILGIHTFFFFFYFLVLALI